MKTGILILTSVKVSDNVFDYDVFVPLLQYGPRQANLVLIAYASSDSSGEPAQSRQNLCCSLIQAVSQEELSDRKPDPWPL